MKSKLINTKQLAAELGINVKGAKKLIDEIRLSLVKNGYQIISPTYLPRNYVDLYLKERYNVSISEESGDLGL